MSIKSVLLALIACVCVGSTAAHADTIRVSVAISLKEAITEVARDFESKSGHRVEFSFGSSGQVMAQIKGGAAIDVFISAADKQVDELQAAGLIDADSRRVIVGNALVLIVPKDSTVEFNSFAALAQVPISKLAIGEPKTVPAGQYAAQVLDKLKLTSAVSEKLVYGANVRQVLNYVARNEVTAGVVYATDAKVAEETVKVVATAPEESHDAIVYPGVVVKSSKHPATAKTFLDFLAKDKAVKAFRSYGFTPGAAKKPANAKP